MQRVPRPASPEDAVYHPRCRTARAAPAAAERTRSRAPRELARPHGRPITPTPHHLSLLLHASVEQGNEAADRGGGTSGYVPRIEKTSWARPQFTTATWPGAQWRQPCARLGLGLCLAEAAGSRQAGPLTREPESDRWIRAAAPDTRQRAAEGKKTRKDGAFRRSALAQAGKRETRGQQRRGAGHQAVHAPGAHGQAAATPAQPPAPSNQQPLPPIPQCFYSNDRITPLASSVPSVQAPSSCPPIHLSLRTHLYHS